MKHLTLFFLCLLFLWGCTPREEPNETTVLETTRMTIIMTEPTEITLPTEPATMPTTLPEPADEDFVRILEYIPTASQELFYSTENNFTGHVIYEFHESYLRYGTTKKLMQVSEELAQLGLYIKIWDGFRPPSAQFKLWEILPDDTYVADPRQGFSKHSRGNTVDLTLVDAEGRELDMPTEFDDFSSKADRNYSDCTDIQRDNAMLLQTTMEKHGFTGYYGEWWHFSDTDVYPVEHEFQPPVG